MKHREFFDEFRERPSMYISQVTLEAIEGYLAGYDAATNGGTLRGWREWLILRLRHGTNLGWEALARMAIEAPEHPGDETERFARRLLDLLAEFWEERDGDRAGLRLIMYRYERWLREQSWYDPEHPIP